MEVTGQGKVTPAEDVVVFSILNPSMCAECRAELSKGDLLRIEKEKPLCLDCADLGHLLYLSRGDTALTRRSRKYSVLSAVVVSIVRQFVLWWIDSLLRVVVLFGLSGIGNNVRWQR